MLGNDVVDLGDAETAPGAQHPRFDARVFGAEERRRIESSSDPRRARWTLWAAKEAAYKAARKRNVRCIFAPRAFLVCGEALRPECVEWLGLVFRLDWHFDGDCIHALAWDAPPRGEILSAMQACSSGDASAELRRVAAEAIARREGCAAAELEWRRAGRIPRLHRAGRPLELDLSLAHHGRWLAFACDLGAAA